MVQMLFSQIQQAPGPDFKMVGKYLDIKLFEDQRLNMGHMESFWPHVLW